MSMHFKTLKHKELPGVYAVIRDYSPECPILHSAIPMLFDKNTTMEQIVSNLTFIRLFEGGGDVKADLEQFELVNIYCNE